MSINLTDLGCEVAEEDMSTEVIQVNRKVVPRSKLTDNIDVELVEPDASPFEIRRKTNFNFDKSKQMF